MPIQLTLDDMKMLPASAFTWPVTYAWETRAPWGTTRQELSVDIPFLDGNLEASRLFGTYLWSFTIATAISVECELDISWCQPWRTIGVTLPVVGFGQRGMQPGRASSRDDSGQWVLIGDEISRQWRRRVFLPGIPRDAVSGGQLTKRGFEDQLTAARAAFMGLQPIPPDAMCSWLIAYRNIVPESETNFYGIGFRRVKSVHVCQHTDRAPDNPGGLWP